MKRRSWKSKRVLKRKGHKRSKKTKFLEKMKTRARERKEIQKLEKKRRNKNIFTRDEGDNKEERGNEGVCQTGKERRIGRIQGLAK